LQQPSVQPAVEAPHQPMIWLAGAVALGIVVDRYAPLTPTWWFAAAMGLLLLWWMAWTCNLRQVSIVCLLLAGSCVGGARHHLHWSVFEQHDIGLLAQEESVGVSLRAVALESPHLTPAPPPNPLATIQVGDRSHLRIRVTAYRRLDIWRPATGITTLRVDGHLPQVRTGDQIEVVGQLYQASPDENPGGFNFRDQQRKDRELCRLSAANPDSVQVLKHGTRWSARRLLAWLRSRGNETFAEHLRPSTASLASALLLGEREQLDRERTDRFFLSGVIHLLAISGLHVAMLTSGVWLLGRFGFTSRRTTLALVIGFVMFYALLTDARPPVVRAATVITAMCFAAWAGRPVTGLNTLAAAAIVVLAINPAELFSTGAQLSFLAVGVLSVCAPLLAPRPIVDPLDRLIAQTRPWPVRAFKRGASGLGRAFLAGAAVWLVTLPLVMHRFHLAAPAALVLGPLLAPLTAIGLFSGFALLVSGWIFPPLAPVFAYVCDGSLSLLEGGVAYAAQWPGGHWWTPGASWWWTAIFYAVLLWLALSPRWRPSIPWRVALPTAWAAAGLLVIGAAPIASESQSLDCTFISLGHGLSVFIETPEGRTVLYDAGRLGVPEAGARSIAAVIWSRGYTHLDAVVLSHADADHYNALPTLLEQFSVGEIYVSPYMFEQESSALARLKQAIEASGAKLRSMATGDQIAFPSSLKIRCLHPPRGQPQGSDNANSIVLSVEHQKRVILLTGDVEKSGLRTLLGSPPVDCDVTLAPHHGSIGSEPARFARWCRPEWVVISSGRGRDLSLSREAFEAAGANVLNTSTAGAVRVRVQSGEISLRSWREKPW